MAMVSVRRGEMAWTGVAGAARASYQTFASPQTAKQVAADLSVSPKAIRQRRAT